MNTLGKMKVLLELNALRGFTERSTPSGQMDKNPLFEELLEQSLAHHQSRQLHSPLSRQFIDMNTLGAVYKLKNVGSAQTIPKPPFGVTTLSAEAIVENQHIASNFEAIIKQAAITYELPEKLIKSIIKHESNFKSNALSKAGASGLMQLMPATARGLGVTSIFDPEQNIMGGSKYLRNMLDKYKGNLDLALAAYNAGPGNVDKYGGIPPFKETQAYVKKVSSSFYS